MKAKIRYGLSRTINLGSYESAKVDVALELVCDQDDEASLDTSFEKAKDWVDAKIKEEEMRWKT